MAHSSGRAGQVRRLCPRAHLTAGTHRGVTSPTSAPGTTGTSKCGHCQHTAPPALPHAFSTRNGRGSCCVTAPPQLGPERVPTSPVGHAGRGVWDKRVLGGRCRGRHAHRQDLLSALERRVDTSLTLCDLQRPSRSTELSPSHRVGGRAGAGRRLALAPGWRPGGRTLCGSLNAGETGE